MPSKYTTRDGSVTVEVIALERDGVRTCFKVTRHGYHARDCRTVDEVAKLVRLADLEPVGGDA